MSCLARLSPQFFTVIRATDLCLRDHVCWRFGTGIDSGAGLPAVMPVHLPNFLSMIDYDCP